MSDWKQKVKNFLKTGDTHEEVNKTCHDPAKDLVDCMSETKCFQSGRSIQDCANNDSEAIGTCNKQMNEYYLCRRFTVDHTKHFVKDTYK